MTSWGLKATSSLISISFALGGLFNLLTSSLSAAPLPSPPPLNSCSMTRVEASGDSRLLGSTQKLSLTSVLWSAQKLSLTRGSASGSTGWRGEAKKFTLNYRTLSLNARMVQIEYHALSPTSRTSRGLSDLELKAHTLSVSPCLRLNGPLTLRMEEARLSRGVLTLTDPHLTFFGALGFPLPDIRHPLSRPLKFGILQLGWGLSGVRLRAGPRLHLLGRAQRPLALTPTLERGAVVSRAGSLEGWGAGLTLERDIPPEDQSALQSHLTDRIETRWLRGGGGSGRAQWSDKHLIIAGRWSGEDRLPLLGRQVSSWLEANDTLGLRSALQLLGPRWRGEVDAQAYMRRWIGEGERLLHGALSAGGGPVWGRTHRGQAWVELSARSSVPLTAPLRAPLTHHESTAEEALNDAVYGERAMIGVHQALRAPSVELALSGGGAVRHVEATQRLGWAGLSLRSLGRREWRSGRHRVSLRAQWLTWVDELGEGTASQRGEVWRMWGGLLDPMTRPVTQRRWGHQRGFFIDQSWVARQGDQRAMPLRLSIMAGIGERGEPGTEPLTFIDRWLGVLSVHLEMDSKWLWIQGSTDGEIKGGTRWGEAWWIELAGASLLSALDPLSSIQSSPLSARAIPDRWSALPLYMPASLGSSLHPSASPERAFARRSSAHLGVGLTTGPISWGGQLWVSDPRHHDTLGRSPLLDAPLHALKLGAQWYTPCACLGLELNGLWTSTGAEEVWLRLSLSPSPLKAPR